MLPFRVVLQCVGTYRGHCHSQPNLSVRISSECDHERPESNLCGRLDQAPCLVTQTLRLGAGTFHDDTQG
ncbi:hypothetical protein GCM10008097_27660 [Mycetocola manganoxydans]|nr:hypothetical protein GCM10008097_27660 [Mycetocola manganoxydans]